MLSAFAHPYRILPHKEETSGDPCGNQLNHICSKFFIRYCCIICLQSADTCCSARTKGTMVDILLHHMLSNELDGSQNSD